MACGGRWGPVSTDDYPLTGGSSASVPPTGDPGGQAEGCVGIHPPYIEQLLYDAPNRWEGTRINLKRISVPAAALLAAVLLPSAAAAGPGQVRVVANAENTGIRTPVAELSMVTDTSIEEWAEYDGVKFPAGSPVVVGPSGASFTDTFFPSGLVFDGTQVSSYVEDSTVVGGVVLSSTHGVSLSHVEVTRANVGVDVLGDQGRPAYDTGLDTIWVHNPLAVCGYPANGVHLRGAQGFVLQRSTIDMGGWELGCGGFDIVNAAFDADDGWDGNADLAIFGTNLNGGAITFQRGTFGGLEDGFTVRNTLIGPGYHYAAQGFPPPGPAVTSIGNAQVTQTTPPQLTPLVIL